MDRRRRYFEEEKDRFLLLYRRLGAEAAARYVCASLSGGGRTPQRRRCTDIGKKFSFFLSDSCMEISVQEAEWLAMKVNDMKGHGSRA
jgi:hypothetical protein